MTDLPPRRFSQIRLSTAVMLLLTAGALLFANMQPNLFFWTQHFGNISGMGATYYGFPFCIYSTTGFPYDSASHWSGRIFAALLNVSTTLLPAAVLCEFRIRHPLLFLNRLTPGLFAFGVLMAVYGTLEKKMSPHFEWDQYMLSPYACIAMMFIPALAVMLSIGLCLEFLIRPREAPKP
jgi:hypothetical protein